MEMNNPSNRLHFYRRMCKTLAEVVSNLLFCKPHVNLDVLILCAQFQYGKEIVQTTKTL